MPDSQGVQGDAAPPCRSTTSLARPWKQGKGATRDMRRSCLHVHLFKDIVSDALSALDAFRVPRTVPYHPKGTAP